MPAAPEQQTARTIARTLEDSDSIQAFTDFVMEQGPRSAEPVDPTTDLETWVAFQLAGEWYGLPVTVVQEILRVGTITRVPHAPDSIRGIVNMRGRALPVVDMRLRLRLPAAEIGSPSRILVVSVRNRLLGLLVDSVQQVLQLDRNEVDAPPRDVLTEQSEYLSGVYHLTDGPLVLLDVGRLLLSPGPPSETPVP